MNQLAIPRLAAPTWQPTRATFAVLRRVRAQWAVWAQRQRERAALASLDERGLQDIGISRAQAQFEAEQPFWRDFR